MSKITLRHIQSICSELNVGLLRQTFWGISAARRQNVITLSRQARRHEKTSEEGVVFEGSPKECVAYLAAVKDWVTVPYLARIEED